jgi:hypothetical protein
MKIAFLLNEEIAHTCFTGACRVIGQYYYTRLGLAVA